MVCFLAIPEQGKEEPREQESFDEFSNRICEFRKNCCKIKLLEEKDFRKICKESVGENALLIPGQLIKHADRAAAYAEAVYSINLGLRSNELMKSADKLMEELFSTEFAEIAEVLKYDK